MTPETHPFAPWIPEGARLLMCGTFPPAPKRWSMEFYYPNYINDMWRIFGLIYFGDKDALVDVEHKTFRLPEIKELTRRIGLALSDTGREIVRTRNNAADKDLDIRGHIDLDAMLATMPKAVAVATTGEKAAGVIAGLTGTEIPAVGTYVECVLPMPDGTRRHFRHWRMPSSSRAYPLPLEKKTEHYRRMLEAEGMAPIPSEGLNEHTKE
ncbi:MAG: uracil-DNA glycosylase family protein [Muribaculaceae bacterium]|nr:uracil-DNA glycosylase family protein [Muribaculaceae bacterium]